MVNTSTVLESNAAFKRSSVRTTGVRDEPSAFEQSACAALERCALYLIPHLPYAEYEGLVKALWGVRRALKSPQPRKHALLDLRDWPSDPQAGDALKALLIRLDELEDEERRAQSVDLSQTKG